MSAKTQRERDLVVSVLLPTVHSWPTISSALESLLAQIDAPPFEVLVLDGHGQALSGAPHDPDVSWIRLPGQDSFALRAAGIARARGAVIAITEDHCIVPTGWLASIAAAHRVDSSAAIVGAVCNHPESALLALDRANFILTFAGQTPNRLSLRHGRLPVPTNLSFKRNALRSPHMAPGELEYRWLAELLQQNQLGTTETVLLHHRQSWGNATWGIHVASGRSYGATVRSTSSRTRVVWWLTLLFAPLRLARLVLAELSHGAAGKPVAIRDLLCVAGLIAANLLGQMVGALLGPGQSRTRL